MKELKQLKKWINNISDEQIKYLTNKEVLNKNDMELEVIHIFNNKRRRYVETLNILLFEAAAMVTVTKSYFHFLLMYMME